MGNALLDPDSNKMWRRPSEVPETFDCQNTLENFYAPIVAREAKEAGIEDVDENNVADLLVIMRDIARNLRYLSFYPLPIFSTRQTCDAFIKKHEWMLPTLKLVHERGIYAWFVKKGESSN